MEIKLPDGVSFRDKDEIPRTKIRTKWWQAPASTYKELALVSDEVIEQIPNSYVTHNISPGYDDIKPVFVGHYWLTGEPRPLTAHIACLDYSIATNEKQSKLCAYRWNGEKALSEDNFVWVS